MSEYTGVHVTRSSKDELKHWKYTRREVRNGKYVYYYDDEQDIEKRIAIEEYMKKNPGVTYEEVEALYNAKMEERYKKFENAVRKETQRSGVVKHSDELKHYGVKGMRWGIIRAQKKLSRATTDEARAKAISKLERHKVKGTSKVEKIQKQQSGLTKELDRSGVKDIKRASKLESKAASIDRQIHKKMIKAGGMFTSEKRRNSLVNEAQALKIRSDALHAKASSYKTNYESIKAKIESNDRLIGAFKSNLKDLDRILVDAGKQYVS